MISLLFIATRFPYPPHSGEKLRVFKLLSELSRAYQVTLVCLGDVKDSDVEGLIKATGVYAVILFKPRVAERLYGLLRSLLRGQPLQVGYFKSSALRHWITTHGSEFDIGVFHTLRGAQYADVFSRGLCVLEMCDANSEIYRQNVQVTPRINPWHWISRYESYFALRAEKAACRRFDVVTFHTWHDARVVANEFSNIFISTQGVDLEAYPYKSVHDRSSNELVFIGKMDFRPNLDAVSWFIDAVMPRLSKDVRLKIIGVCPPSIEKFLKRKSNRVSITGRVDSISDAAQTGTIGIAPMRSAAGIQNKVLEYFALGLPVVATPTVLKGLQQMASECLLVASTVDQWIAAIDALRTNPTLAVSLAESGRAYVEGEHGWSRIGEEYLAEINIRLQEKLVTDQPQERGKSAADRPR